MSESKFVDEVDFEVRYNVDGTVTIWKRVWRTRISGRGRERGSMEFVESSSWEFDDAREAFELARDIFETLVFYQPRSESNG